MKSINPVYARPPEVHGNSRQRQGGSPRHGPGDHVHHIKHINLGLQKFAIVITVQSGHLQVNNGNK